MFFFMFFFSPPGEKKKPKRELVARSDVEEMSTLSTVLRDSLRSNRSSHHLKVPCLVVAFLCYISRYRNHIRSKGLCQRSKVLSPFGGAGGGSIIMPPLCILRLSSRKATGKATGRRAKLGNGRVSGNLGIVGYCLPPSHLGYSSILDSTRFGVGSSKLNSVFLLLARHSPSKLGSTLASSVG